MVIVCTEHQANPNQGILYKLPDQIDVGGMVVSIAAFHDTLPECLRTIKIIRKILGDETIVLVTFCCCDNI